MQQDQSTDVQDRRSGDRAPIDGAITVCFDEQQVVGPGQNMSEDGVFFVVEAALRVRVRVGAEERWRDAEVVRVQSMGEGRLGMAVRFLG